MTSPMYGPKLMYADDPSDEWQQAKGVALPEEGDAALERIWVIVAGEGEGTVYAGGDPGAPFESRDDGATWELNRGLWEHPTRPTWEPGGGGLWPALDNPPGPGTPDRLALAVSAAGVWLTEDGGKKWRGGQRGLVPRYLPKMCTGGRQQPLCPSVSTVRRSGPSGCSCSFTAASTGPTTPAQTWTDIASGLPSDFGFPMALDPGDPDSAFVIPLASDEDRVTPAAACACMRRATPAPAGRSAATGCRRQDAYLTVLRHAFIGPGEGIGTRVCTSAPRRETSFARATPERTGRLRRLACRPFTR